MLELTIDSKVQGEQVTEKFKGHEIAQRGGQVQWLGDRALERGWLFGGRVVITRNPMV